MIEYDHLEMRYNIGKNHKVTKKMFVDRIIKVNREEVINPDNWFNV